MTKWVNKGDVSTWMGVACVRTLCPENLPLIKHLDATIFWSVVAPQKISNAKPSNMCFGIEPTRSNVDPTVVKLLEWT